MKRLSKKKFVKNVKRRVPWIGHIINDAGSARDFHIGSKALALESRHGSLCLMCRGSRMLCGKYRCPALLKLYSFLQVKKKVTSEHITGSSPPGVFVGRIGYPHVYAGPLVPPLLGDTSLFNTPEDWLGRTIEEIVGFRTSLIRGKFRVNVKKPRYNEGFLDKTLDLALSKGSVEADITFQRKPSDRFLIDETVQPMGPSAIMRKLRVGSNRTDLRIEQAYRDSDLKAANAILSLYSKHVPVSKIQSVFSLGTLGVKGQRRMVPTRWSITAVDSTLSRRILKDEVKGKPLINEYRVFEFNYLGNKFIVVLTPSSWKYEWIEAWYPRTHWNPKGQRVAMGSDWEGYRGRTTYASLGGCYYSVRLAAAEYLARENRQAGVIAMREIYPSYLTPLGVWINREGVRAAFREREKRFNTLNETLVYVDSRFQIRLDDWIGTSKLLKDELYQKKISSYLY